MVRSDLPFRLAQLARICAAQRQLSRAEKFAAGAAFERAEEIACVEVGYRDEALDFWTAVLSDPTAALQLRVEAQAWVVERERKVHDAKRAAAAARERSEAAAQALAEASARHEVSKTNHRQAILARGRLLDERQAGEVQDLLQHRRRP